MDELAHGNRLEHESRKIIHKEDAIVRETGVNLHQTNPVKRGTTSGYKFHLARKCTRTRTQTHIVLVGSFLGAFESLPWAGAKRIQKSILEEIYW